LSTLPLDVEPPTDVIWYGLFHYYLFLGFAAGTIVICFMIYSVAKNRARKGVVRPAPKFEDREHLWGNWKGTLMILLLTGSVLAFVEYQTFASTGLVVAPDGTDTIHIEVIGQQWDWIFVYPNGVRVIGNLTVPQNAEVVLNVTSDDVAHSFTIPSLSIAKDAVPGHFNALWFNATGLGSYTIRCKELCGIGHALMTGTLTVMSPAAYEQWYSSLQLPTGIGLGGSSGQITNPTTSTNSSVTSTAEGRLPT